MVAQNAMDLTFLVQEYPDQDLGSVLSLMEGLSPIDLNVAVWKAEDWGWITVDKDKGKAQVVEGFEYSPNDSVLELESLLIYAFEKLSDDEVDLEEYQLNEWMQGYPAHYRAIALKRLISKEVITTYKLTNKEKESESVYTFYTLCYNRDKQWGLKQFKDQERVETTH